MRAVGEGVFVLLAGAFGVWGAWLVPPPLAGDTWAGVAPMAVSCFLVLCGALMILGSWRTFKLASFAPSRELLEVCALALLAFAYYQLIVWFGYVLPTFIIAPAVLFAFGMRSKLKLVAAALLCAGFLFCFFIRRRSV